MSRVSNFDPSTPVFPTELTQNCSLRQCTPRLQDDLMRQMLTNHRIVEFQISALFKLRGLSWSYFHKFWDVRQHFHKDQQGWSYGVNDGKKRVLGTITWFLGKDMYDEHWYG